METPKDANQRPMSLSDLDRRSREVFREIVEAYLDTGEPIGSRTLSRASQLSLSPASIRNTMADLAQAGLLTAPHSSAGRLPTHLGLRLFVDGLLEVGDVTEDERAAIDSQVAGKATSLDDALEKASDLLSGLAGGAGLVTTPSHNEALRHVEFVTLGPHETMAVLVFADGSVENRLMRTPDGITPASLQEAGSYLSMRLKDRTLEEARAAIRDELAAGRAALDEAATRLVEDGFAAWSEGSEKNRTLIVRGRANLLQDQTAVEDLERIRLLFRDLEHKEELIDLLDSARDADAVRIFIGAENPLFSLSGSSLIAAPYMNARQRIVGALGVIAPTRLNYARVIPLVDYTARVVSRLLDDDVGPNKTGKP